MFRRRWWQGRSLPSMPWIKITAGETNFIIVTIIIAILIIILIIISILTWVAVYINWMYIETESLGGNSLWNYTYIFLQVCHWEGAEETEQEAFNKWVKVTYDKGLSPKKSWKTLLLDLKWLVWSCLLKLLVEIILNFAWT